MARKATLGRSAHIAEGVVGGDAGGPELLQQQGLEVDEMVERAGDVEDRLAGADPGAFGVDQLDVEPRAARSAAMASSHSSASRGAETTGRRMKMA